MRILDMSSASERHSYYEITLNYGRNYPIFKDHVQARDEDHSKLLGRFNAEAKGYPKNVEFEFDAKKSAY